jgi:hypothetical protein
MVWSESALWMCPNCGTSNVEGTRYCERCNLPLVPPPPTVPAKPTSPASTQTFSPPPQTRRRTSRRNRGIARKTVLAVVLVVVIGVIASLALVAHFDPAAFSAPSPSIATPPPANKTNYTVSVTQINYYPSSCWANTSGSGVTVSSGSQFSTSLSLKNTGTKTCVVSGASVTTNGFSIADSNVPLNLPPGQSGSLHLTIQTPNFEVRQSIGIDLTVTVLG